MVLSVSCRLGSENHPAASLSTLQYGVSYSRGLPAADGRPADGNSLRITSSHAVTVTFVPVDGGPESFLEPAESQIQMITTVPADSAIAAVAGLLRKARIGTVQSETQILEHAAIRDPRGVVFRQTLYGVLPDGVVAGFGIFERPVADAGALRKLEIQVRHGADGERNGNGPGPTGVSLEISLLATGAMKETAVSDMDVAPNSGKGQKQSPSAACDLLATETVVLKPQSVREQSRLAVILPSPFDIEGIAAFAAVIEIERPPEKGTAEADTYATMVKECQDQLQAAMKEAGGRAGPPFDAARGGIEEAIRLVQSPTHGRQALLFLAQQGGAPLVEDITLSATDTVVDRLAYAVANEFASGPAVNLDGLGWRLQKTAYLLVADLLSTDQTWPELEAIVIRHTGEAGRHPAVLKEMAVAATGTADIEQRLLLENFIYLEDISPAARTRAFEWLAARGRAPQGYDPLASSKERRTVLNRVLQEQQ
jgi:hypothetical protein